MNSQQTLIAASLSDLISSCCKEQNRLVPAQGICFELFRRAIELGDDPAWFAVQQQFRPLFVRWVYESYRGVLDHFMVEDLLQTALERFWCALAASPVPLADRFACTGALLKYMKQCIRSACREWQRSEMRAYRLHQRLAADAQSTPEPRPLERLWTQKAAAVQQENLRRWLQEQCQDEAEKMVYRLSFEEELKPGQIVTRHPEHFPDVQDVYRIKLRLYRRIQRSFGLGG
ncbi:MAG: sigma-70 family RNA polymerase sigma factor [Ardenticatenaceae bacterium]|nr:sigma-70 family RNA polymerase sigma factor [Ardenticatenaceae bacterium]